MKHYLSISCLCAFSAMAMPALADDAVSAADEAEETGFTYKFGGKIRARSDSFDQLYSNDGKAQSETYIRRADIEVSGQFLSGLDYELEVKLDREGKAKLKTAEVDWDLPAHFSLAAGRFDPDFGLELSGSSTWVTGIERSAIWDLAPYAGEGAEASGLALRNHHKHYFVSAGYFDTPDGPVTDARLVYAPIQKKTHVLHLGYSYAEELDSLTDGEIKSDLAVWSLGFSDDGNSTKLARDKAAGAFRRDKSQALELAYMNGPFSLQAEFLQRDLLGLGTQADRTASGSYAQIAYTLTGEARDYSMSNAKFGRIKPVNKYGAWEIFLRKDQLHTSGEAGLLNKKRSDGKAEVDVLGINWYSPVNWKVSANYLRATTAGTTNGIPNDVGDIAGNGYSLQVQFRF